jgi:hypothetical protein
MFRLADGYSVYSRCFWFPLQRAPIFRIPEDTVWCSHEAETMPSAYLWMRFTTVVLLASVTSLLTRGISVQALHVAKVKYPEVHGKSMKSMATEMLKGWATWMAQRNWIVMCVQCSCGCCVRRWSSKTFSLVQGRLRLLLTSMNTEVPFRDLYTGQRAFGGEGLLPYAILSSIRWEQCRWRMGQLFIVWRVFI